MKVMSVNCKMLEFIGVGQSLIITMSSVILLVSLDFTLLNMLLEFYLTVFPWMDSPTVKLMCTIFSKYLYL